MLASPARGRYDADVDETILHGPAWTDEQRMTWRRIASHPFEAPHEAFDFLHRLARDRAWSLGHAGRAIEEYRRFCFLSVVCGCPVTPSQDVDEVWHQHLTYSRDYWDVWCAQVLRRRLHHDPTEGGPAEARKFREQYAVTLAAYERWFGPPPDDLWPSTQRRFAARPRFRTIDTDRVFTVPRPRLPQRWVWSVIALLAASLAPWPVMALPDSPLDWPAEPFLMLFAGELAVAGLLAAGTRRWLRAGADDRAGDVDLDPVELGYLAGGPARAFDAAMTELMVHGVVSVDGFRRLRVSDRGGAAVNEWQRHVRDGSRYQATRRAGQEAVAAVRARLVRLGLALEPGQVWRATLIPLLFFGPVLPIGLLRMQSGAARGHPTGYLAMLLWLTVAALVWSCLRRPWRTRAGDRALRELRSANTRLIRAPMEAELPFAVALVGPAVLGGTAFAGYARLARAAGDGGGCSGGSDGGGDSGGGDGGSGCGGCST